MCFSRIEKSSKSSQKSPDHAKRKLSELFKPDPLLIDSEETSSSEIAFEDDDDESETTTEENSSEKTEETEKNGLICSVFNFFFVTHK